MNIIERAIERIYQREGQPARRWDADGLPGAELGQGENDPLGRALEEALLAEEARLTVSPAGDLSPPAGRAGPRAGGPARPQPDGMAQAGRPAQRPPGRPTAPPQQMGSRPVGVPPRAAQPRPRPAAASAASRPGAVPGRGSTGPQGPAAMPALRPEVDATATTAADGRGGAASPPGPVNPPASADLAEQPALATVASGSAEGPEAAPAANRTQTGAESPASTSESHSADEQASRSEALQPAGLGEPDARADPYPPAMPSVEAEPSPDAPTGSRRFIIAGILALVLGVGVLGGWAALAPLQSASIAPGVIRTAGGHRTVQHLEGGIIEEVLVEDGNRVETGQVLIRLESAQARANRDLLRGRHDALSTLLARLLSERDGKPAIEYSAEILARMDTPEVARLVAGETDVFNARREAMKGQLDILDRRLRQSRQEIAGLEAQRASSRRQISLVNEELAAARTLYEKGIYEKPKYLALQRTVAKFDGDIGEFAANIARTQERIAETESAILDVGNQRLKEVTDRLQETQRQLFDTEDRLRAAEDVLERTLIRAPDGGVVVGLRYRTRGGVIPPHATLLEIVPADDTPVVDARISPGDIDSVHEGLRADVRLTAFSYRTTPMVQGTLVRVSADRLLDDKTGQPYYEGRIQLDPDSLAKAKHIQLYPGMAAEVHILTGERTVLQYLLRPITDSMSRAWREG